MNAPNAPCQNVGSNADETGCFTAASESANKNLNRLYAQISRILVTAERDQLLTAERLWIRYRETPIVMLNELYTVAAAAGQLRMPPALLQIQKRESPNSKRSMAGVSASSRFQGQTEPHDSMVMSGQRWTLTWHLSFSMASDRDANARRRHFAFPARPQTLPFHSFREDNFTVLRVSDCRIGLCDKGHGELCPRGIR